MGEFHLFCPSLTSARNVCACRFFALFIDEKRKVNVEITRFNAPKIKYKYPDEDWQEIDGDDYLLDNTPANTELLFSQYFIEFEATVNGRFPPLETRPVIYNHGDTIRGTINASFANIILSSIVGDSSKTNWDINFDFLQGSNSNAPERYEETTCFKRNINWQVRGNESNYRNAFRTLFSTASNVGVTNLRNFTLVKDTSRNPLVCKTIKPKCVFKVYKCEEIVHEETREVCPEVIKIPCQLDIFGTANVSVDLEEDDLFILIEGKTGFLPPTVEALIALTGAIVNGDDFNLYLTQQINIQGITNPHECLLLLKVKKFQSVEIIGQFCSDGCPPPADYSLEPVFHCPLPIYNVVCENLEQCPPDTCKIDCGDHICCYDENGINLKTIFK